jgi:hypothetical protein
MRHHAKGRVAMAAAVAEAGPDAEHPVARGTGRFTVAVTDATVHQLEMNQTELL